MTFVEAAAFQWANPKAWAMALTTVSVYAGAGSLREVAPRCCVFPALVNFPCVGVWAVGGRPLRASRRTKAGAADRSRTAILIILSLAPLAWEP